jgi:hypothetical protein
MQRDGEVASFFPQLILGTWVLAQAVLQPGTRYFFSLDPIIVCRTLVRACHFFFDLPAKSQPKLTDLDSPCWLAPMPLYVSNSGPGSTSAQSRSGCTATTHAVPLTSSVPLVLCFTFCELTADPQSAPRAFSSTVHGHHLSRGCHGPVSGNNEVVQNREPLRRLSERGVSFSHTRVNLVMFISLLLFLSSSSVSRSFVPWSSKCGETRERVGRFARLVALLKTH